MKNWEILIAGFGGQGVLFAGKFLVTQGLNEGKHVSWLPSYGPEMRGGTANCSVNISEDPIGSPIVSKPDILVAMNLPSLDKYEDEVKAGGFIFVDSSLISRKVRRSDVTAVYVPATRLANENGLQTLANMILTGAVIRETGCVSTDNLEGVLSQVVSAKHRDLLGFNKQALEMGYNYTKEEMVVS